MMKTIFKATLATAAVIATGLAFTACDDVKEGDRYIYLGELKAERNVLIEDFTGQFCSNCPDAHHIIEQLEAQYGNDKVIAVSIHCGGLGLSKQYTDFPSERIGLMTEEGNTIMSTYGIKEWPMGSVNMQKATDRFQWAGQVRTALETPTDVNINLTVGFEADKSDPKVGTISMKADVMSSSDRNAKVQFWVVESGIVAQQRLENGTTDNNYVHNNVFRGMAYDLNGYAVDFKAGIEQTVETSMEAVWNGQEHWQVENLAVVAIVFDGSGVLNVVRKPVIPQSEIGD